MSELNATPNHKEITLRGAPNNVATQVKPCEPWNFAPRIPAEALKSKDHYKKWRGLPATEHLVFTGYEGVNPDIRINSKTNPVKRLHALVVDFDGLITGADCATVLERCPVDLRPTWLARSFSDGARLVWMFESPLSHEVDELTEEFLKIAYRELKIAKLLAGPDDGAFYNVSMLYDVGRDWRKLGDYALSTSVLHFWLTEAAKKTRWDKLGEFLIPIETIAEEVERRFPGRWEGPFEVGCRGVCFFDPNSTNPTSSIVTEAGMICFSQAQLFHPWSKIFGDRFIRKLQADKIGGAVAGIWFDGKSYYRKIGGAWMAVAKEDFAKWLCSRQRLDPSRGKHTASEVTNAEVFVQEHHRVAGAIPRLFDPRDVIDVNGQKFLNSAYVRAMQPADIGGLKWGERFSFLANFFESRFDPIEQLDFFRAWHKRFYQSALAGNLEKGQAVFVVGGVNSGKTLLGNKIIGASVGGFADASDYVAKGSEFNRHLMDVGLWVIDDGQVASDPVAHRKFSEMVKRIVANPVMGYRAMYRDVQMATWNGRLFVTLNDDIHSIQMLPDLSTSMEEKVLVFRFSNRPFAFPPRAQLEAIIAAEMPYYGRWLLDWPVPTHVIGDSRLGVAPYIHEEVRAQSLHSSGVGDILEIVAMWDKRREPTGDFWDCSASEWYTDVANDEILRPLIQKFNPRSVGKRFSEAARIRDSGISVAVSSRMGNKYRIARAAHKRKL